MHAQACARGSSIAQAVSFGIASYEATSETSVDGSMFATVVVLIWLARSWFGQSASRVCAYASIPFLEALPLALTTSKGEGQKFETQLSEITFGHISTLTKGRFASTERTSLRPRASLFRQNSQLRGASISKKSMLKRSFSSRRNEQV